MGYHYVSTRHIRISFALVDGIFGLDFGDTFVIKQLDYILLHVGIIFALSLSYNMFVSILNTILIIWYNNMTNFQRISILHVKTAHWILSSAILLQMLTLKTLVVPYLFLNGLSPQTIRPSENLLVQQSVIQKYNISSQPALFRAIGEDLHLTCRTYAPLHANDKKLIWMLNGSSVPHDERHILSFRRSEYIYIHELVIRHIEVTDFGEYRCLQRNAQHYIEEFRWKAENYCVSDLAPNEVSIKSLDLKLSSKHLAEITARVGTVFNMKNVLIYHILRDDNLELLHTVNGLNHSDVCSNLRHASGHIPTKHQIEYRVPSCSSFREKYLCNISFAICVNSFGIHEFALVKQGNFNNTPVHHQIRLLIKPEGTIMSTKDKYTFYDQLLTKLVDQNVTDAELTNLTFQLIQAKESLELRTSEIFSILVAVSIGLLLFMFLTVLDYFCDKLLFKIIYLFDEDKYRLGLAAEKKKTTVNCEYDIFISFSDADRNFVCKALIPLLETRFHLRVCQPDIDIQPGHPLWAEYSDNISKSNKIIVVLSPDYLQDPFCNQMQFSMIIVPMLCTSDKTFQDVFLLEYEKCEVPAFYSNILPVCSWYAHCDEDILQLEISNWIESSELSVFNMFNKISFKIAMLIEQFI